MSKDPNREIAIKLVYYLVVAKSSRRNYKYFKPKIVIIIYLHERVSIQVLRTWWVKVLRKIKNLENREEEGEKPQKEGYILGNLFSSP